MKSVLKYFAFSLLLIIIDQCIKLWVHNNMLPGYPGQINIIGDFVKLHYVLNRGMAFGLEIPLANGKIILTVFRLVAMIMIGVYLNYLYQKQFHKGLLWCVAAILGGAIGNLIDSIFYGVALGNAPFDAPNPWFHGQVIDMFFFDIYEGVLPTWIPFLGGTWYSTPIFNFADACIFCGVVVILIFQHRFFKEPEQLEANIDEESVESETEINTDSIENKAEIDINTVENTDNQLNTNQNDKEN